MDNLRLTKIFILKYSNGQKEQSAVNPFHWEQFQLLSCFAEIVGSFSLKQRTRANLMVDGVFRGGATLKMLWDEGKALKNYAVEIGTM